MNSAARVWRRLLRVRELNWRERAVFAEAWAELLAADALVSMTPYRWWRRRLSRDGAGQDAHWGASQLWEARAGQLPARRLLQIFGLVADHHVRPMSCLRRALALRRMLHRRGIASELRFGARRLEGAWDAHVWLEVAGCPVELDDTVRVRYAEMQPGGQTWH